MVSGYVIWPYASLYGLYADLKSEDVEGVKERVDWGSLQNGFQEDLDRFVLAATEKALRSLGDGVSLSWKGASLSKEIASVFATPRGLISLHKEPRELRCTIIAIRSSKPDEVNACLDRQRSKPRNKKRDVKRDVSFEGPNFKRFYEKFRFIFFTGLFSFRVEVVHKGIPVTLDFSRRTDGWLLIRLSIPFERLLPTDD